MITSTATLAHRSETSERVVYLLQDRVHNVLRYGVINKHQTIRRRWHYVGYVNVERKFWNAVRDEIIGRYPITFEGIESDMLQVPIRLLKTVPADVEDYWIGIDYMDRTQPTEEEVAAILSSIAHYYNAAKRFVV